MAEALEELALFPLETVVFPHTPLQLHIFEDRYRDLVLHCNEEGLELGMVLIRTPADGDLPAEPYMVGTAVTIRDVHHHPDGRIDISVHGERRFRIRRLDYSHPHPVGWVEELHEELYLPTAEGEAWLERARDGFRRLLISLIPNHRAGVRITPPDDPEVLSFVIASLLNLPNQAKQMILETTDVVERLRAVVPELESVLESEDLGGYQSIEVLKVYRIGADDLKEWSGPN